MPSFEIPLFYQQICSKFPRSAAENYLRQIISPETHPRQWMELLRIPENSEEGKRILAQAFAYRMRRKSNEQ